MLLNGVNRDVCKPLHSHTCLVGDIWSRASVLAQVLKGRDSFRETHLREQFGLITCRKNFKCIRRFSDTPPEETALRKDMTEFTPKRPRISLSGGGRNLFSSEPKGCGRARGRRILPQNPAPENGQNGAVSLP